jgi:hypothetical protein
MNSDTHLDGNAVGSLLSDLFGREMTNQRACCDACGTINPLATARVYVDAPGHVVRCANCGTVVFVAVTVPTGVRVSFQALRWVELTE